MFIDFIWLCPRWNIVDGGIIDFGTDLDDTGAKQSTRVPLFGDLQALWKKTWFNSPKHEPTTIQQVL